MVTHDQSEALSISDRVVVMEAGRITQIDTPYRAYERPENHFVSQFIGKANMLPGTIVARDGDAIRIDLGHDLAESGNTAQLPMKERVVSIGDTVTLCIRPEKLRLCAPDAGRLPATVTSRFFLGSQWLYRVDCRLGEVLVCCQNEGTEPLAEGAAVGVDWNSDAIRFVQREARHG
jgi:putative spermidine/putrescine transport system ATP-binding protein